MRFYLMVVYVIFRATSLHAGNFFENMVEEPAIRHDVQTVLSDYSGLHFNRPHIPVLRYTADGRLGGNGFSFTLIKPEALDQTVSFSNQNPRSNVFDATPSQDQPVWVHHLEKDTPNGFDTSDLLKYSYFEDKEVPGKARFVSICDKTKYLPKSLIEDSQGNQFRRNPFRCNTTGSYDDKGEFDCYDLNLIAIYFVAPTTANLSKAAKDGKILNSQNRDPYQAVGGYRSFFNQRIIAVIENPKTATAKIKKIYKKEIKFSKNIYKINELFEPIIVGDGRMMVGRLAGSIQYWTDSKGVLRTTSTDIAYSNYPAYVDGKTTEPCDIDLYGNFKPISHAHFDSSVNKAIYPFSYYQISDPTGEKVPDGANIIGSYPWIDSDAKNLVFNAFDQRNKSLFLYAPEYLSPNRVGTFSPMMRYPCQIGDVWSALGNRQDCSPTNQQFFQTSENRYTIGDEFRGISIFGLWTHGKMVLLDGMINSSDLSFHPSNVGSQNIVHFLNLYKDSDPVKINFGRSTGTIKIDNMIVENKIGGFTLNTTLFDSLENRLFHLPWMKPVTPRDVVWQISSGNETDEVVFDEYINPDVIINAEMTGAFYSNYSVNKNIYFDNSTNSNQPDIRVQNSATSSFYINGEMKGNWQVPAYGKLVNRKNPALGVVGRIESVAMGGIKGKGLWLNDSDTVLKFDLKNTAVRNPEAVAETSFYFGFALDARANFELKNGSSTTIVEFGDGTKVNILRENNESYIKLSSMNTKIKLVKPIEKRSWTHIGLLVRRWAKTISFFQRGNFIGSIQYDNFNPLKLKGSDVEAPLYIGGFKGWIDDVKLIMRNPPNAELICNYARGTVVAYEQLKDVPQWYGDFLEKESNYVEQIHPKVTNSSQHYLCFSKYESNPSQYMAFDINTEKGPNGNGEFKRTSLLFQESIAANDSTHPGLTFGFQRPDSTANRFCLTCHKVDLARFPDTLSIGALAQSSNKMEKAKRQPMQPPPIFSGYISEYLRNLNTDFLSSKENGIFTEKGGQYIDSFINRNPYAD